MKSFSLPIICLLALVSISCSSESDHEIVSDADYFPLAMENSWNYANESQQHNTSLEGTEILTIDNASAGRFNFSQEVNEFAGPFTSLLASGEVYKQNQGQNILYDGQLSIALGSTLPSLEFPLENLMLYNAELSQSDLMFSTVGEIEQDINGFPVTFDYELSSIHRGFSTEELVNDVNYEDVFISELQITLSARVFLVFTNFTILQEQNVISVRNYFAKDTGLILSETVLEATFEDIPEQLGVEIPDINSRSSQKLTDFTINYDL